MVAPNASDPTIAAHGRQRAALRARRLARKSKILEVLEMQEDLRLAMPTANAVQKAALVSAWDKLEDRLRILKGKPLPGSLKPEPPRAKRLKAGLFASSGLAASYPEHAPGAFEMHDAQHAGDTTQADGTEHVDGTEQA